MSLTSDEVNILVYRYLEESGFAHTAFSFVAESQITKSPAARVNLPPGALLAFLQKGLQYTEIEAHLKDDGTAVPFDSEFSLLTPYLPRGGLAPAKPPPSATKRKLTGAAARHRKGRRGGDPADVGDGSFDPSVSETAVLPLTGHAGPVYHCLWNPLHPGLIASGSEDATVRVWNIAALGPHARMSRHLAGQVSAAAISLDHRPSNAAAAAAAAGGAGPTASVTVVDWSPDGSRLATGCTDGPVRIWALQEDGVSMAFSKGLARKAGPILALRWSPDGALVAAGSDADGGVTVWDAATGEVVQSYATHKRMVSDLSWMSIPAAAESVPNGKGEGKGEAGADPAAGGAGGAAARHGDRYRLATCSAERIIYVFGTESPEPLRALAGHSAEVNSLQWSPHGSRLLSASDDQTARVWNLGGLRGAPRAAAAGAEAGSGSAAAAAARADNDTVVVLEGHRKEVYSARWSPRKQPPRRAASASASSSSAAADTDGDGDAPDFLVATASFDHAVKLWNAATGECLRTLTRHSSCVYSVAFSPSGRYLASGSYDSEVLVWDVATGAVVLSYVHGSASANGSPGIFDVRWSSEGNKIAASFVDRTICVLNFDGRSAATDAAAAGAGGGGAPAPAKTQDDQQVVKRSRN